MINKKIKKPVLNTVFEIGISLTAGRYEESKV